MFYVLNNVRKPAYGSPSPSLPPTHIHTRALKIKIRDDSEYCRAGEDKRILVCEASMPRANFEAVSQMVSDLRPEM